MQPKRLFSNILRTRSIIMLECRNSSRMDGGARENFVIFCQKLFLYFGNFAHFLTDWQGSLLCRICKKFGGNHVILGFLHFLWIWTNILFAVRILLEWYLKLFSVVERGRNLLELWLEERDEDRRETREERLESERGTGSKEKWGVAWAIKTFLFKRRWRQLSQNKLKLGLLVNLGLGPWDRGPWILASDWVAAWLWRGTEIYRDLRRSI